MNRRELHWVAHPPDVRLDDVIVLLRVYQYAVDRQSGLAAELVARGGYGSVQPLPSGVIRLCGGGVHQIGSSRGVEGVAAPHDAAKLAVPGHSAWALPGTARGMGVGLGAGGGGE